ncbi:MAG: cellobiose phosphorylase, partial [Candidatus Omnitrophica bacterium]|nr:cellobiose phosphorylase [Candidatus Omnitrophota bacterium]
FNNSKPFANFFPGIAGKYGIPMWVFYVNRGQGIASFGTKDKDQSILEFFPANKSWQLTSLRGFRTFIKVSSAAKSVFYEPFRNGTSNLNYDLSNSMIINAHDLKLNEVNSSLGLEVNVEYFTIPNDSYAALVRKVSIKNTGKSAKSLQIIDGLPQITPFGTNNWFLKKLGRTIEAWMNAENLENDVPFYRLTVDPSDKPEVVHLKEGNFYLAFHENKGRSELIKPIVDPDCIFAQVTDFSYPYEFINQNKFTYPKKQITSSKTPCGFLLLNAKLNPKQEKTFYSVIGYMRSIETLNASIKKIASVDYLETKRAENKNVINNLTNDVETNSSSKEFDLYVKQTYLDNIMRGGYPAEFNSDNGSSIFYLYSRKHGDIERDYNRFQLSPTYLSQGNGNYRDANQNRRSDIWFNPQIKEENLVTFLNLIQTDGFNPLVVKGASFRLIKNSEFEKKLIAITGKKEAEQIISFTGNPFSPGELILFIEDNKIGLKISYDELLNTLLPLCEKIQEAEHGEGFWTDHWTYNLDLIDSFLGLYPDRMRRIFFENKNFTFFDNTEIVKPRSDKYVLRDGKVKQLHSLAADNVKREMIRKRTSLPNLVRSDYGQGEIYSTTLINKLLCLTANKLASLDACGIGIEMEADKPNWYDALNGLPALFGSSLCETLELKRLMIIIKEALQACAIKEVKVTEEILDLLSDLNRLLEEGLSDFDYWDKSYTLKEDYRHKTRLGVSGKETVVTADQLIEMLDSGIKKVETGISKAQDKKTGAYHGYFINEVTRYEVLKSPHIKPLEFKQTPLPLFLEPQVHALKTISDQKKAQKLYQAIRSSSLYDKELKMYKVTDSLKSMPEEIGRCRVFAPGWLEHESIWLHMEYKLFLEALKKGLYKEFYEDFKNALIPFQKPERYGRSILENSSFLVSSAFADKKLHGNGFVARLTGSTAEMIQIWLVMNAGAKPFYLDEHGKLALKFDPKLAGWLFDKNNKYSFNFLSKITVTYHNKTHKDTFGANSAKITNISIIDDTSKTIEIPGQIIPSPYASKIRDLSIKKIDIYLK